MFLTDAELRALTGRAQKDKQIIHLRISGIPFYTNASGHPVVARAVIEGGVMPKEKAAKPWRASVLGS